jgi:hypothetical protein
MNERIDVLTKLIERIGSIKIKGKEENLMATISGTIIGLIEEELKKDVTNERLAKDEAETRVMVKDIFDNATLIKREKKEEKKKEIKDEDKVYKCVWEWIPTMNLRQVEVSANGVDFTLKLQQEFMYRKHRKWMDVAIVKP